MIIKILSVIAFIGSIAWFIKSPDYEPAIAIVTSLSAFIGTCFIENKRKHKSPQNQTVGDNSVGIQSGGNVTIGSIHQKQETTKDAE